jgi:hypothetical protein
MSDLFIPAKPGVRTVSSHFGGGWIFPLDAAGTEALHEFFLDDPAPLEPFGGECGYVVEPGQAQDLVEHLRSCNITWEIG